MKNLLKETIERLETKNKTSKDVLWVGTSNIKVSWEDFAKVADFEYDDSFNGKDEINWELVIMGSDFFLERCVSTTNTSSDYWVFTKIPISTGEITGIRKEDLLVGAGTGFESTIPTFLRQ